VLDFGQTEGIADSNNPLPGQQAAGPVVAGTGCDLLGTGWVIAAAIVELLVCGLECN
jgi:hypothetical protein